MQLLSNSVLSQAGHRGANELIQVLLLYHHLRKQWQPWTRLASSVHSSCFHAHCGWIKLGEHLKHLSNMHCYQHKAFSYSQRQEYANPGKNTARTQCVLNILTGISSLGNHCQQEQMSYSVLRRFNKHGSFQQLPDTSTICCSKILLWNRSHASLNVPGVQWNETHVNQNGV